MAARDNNSAARKWLFRHTKGQRGALAVIIAGNALFAAAGTAFALFCRGVIDSAVSGDKPGILKYALLLAGVVLLQLILRLVCNSLSERVTARCEMDMRSGILSKLLSAESGAVGGYHSGELLNRMFSDAGICAAAISDLVPSAVNLVTQLVCAAVLMIVLEPWFALLFTAAGAVLFGVTRLMRGRLKGLHKQVQAREGAVRSFLQEALESLPVIKVFGAGSRVERRNSDNQQAHYDIRMKRRTFCPSPYRGYPPRIPSTYCRIAASAFLPEAPAPRGTAAMYSRP